MHQIILLDLLQEHLVLILHVLTLLFQGLFHNFQVAKITQVIRELFLDQLLKVSVGKSLRCN